MTLSSFVRSNLVQCHRITNRRIVPVVQSRQQHVFASSLCISDLCLSSSSSNDKRSNNSITTRSISSSFNVPNNSTITMSNNRCNYPLMMMNNNRSTNHTCIDLSSLSKMTFSSSSSSIEDDTIDDTTNTITNYHSYRRSNIRNVAVIAHVDHGKTTLVDQLLKAAAATDKSNTTTISERLMDCGDLEKERGITITSKVTRLLVHGLNNTNNDNEKDDKNVTVINCADTPGHSDFSGEVDRFLSLSDGFILVVDAAEGPKTQTKYVLGRALRLGLKPIVVLNKCDRSDAASKIDSGETEQKLQELFQLLISSSSTDRYTKNLTSNKKNTKRVAPDFITLYASARQGWVTDDPIQALDFAEKGFNATTNPECTMKSLLQYIIQELPEPDVRYYADNDNDIDTTITSDDNDVKPPVHEPEFFENDKFSIAAVTVGYDSYLGRTCTGRILSGSVGINDSLTVIRRRADDNIIASTTSEASAPLVTTPSSTVTGLFIFEGIERVPLKDSRAYAGDVITIAGIPDTIAVGDTLTSTNNPVIEPIDTPPLAPPTLCMDFGANDGPLAGREGTFVASSKIRSRLMDETDNNVTLRVEKSSTDADKTVVYARGELQLGILVEQMRREGYEMIISPPRIITKTCPKTGQTLEPIEEVTIDVDSEYTGTVISALTGDRRGVLIEMSESSATDGKSQVVLEVPSRGLLGFSSEIATATKGSAVVNHLFLEDRPQQNLGSGLVKGKLISNDSGKATGYALTAISQRGVLFIEPGDEVYSGMVIGENAKPNDMEVNTIRAKDKTNIRTTAKDEKVTLSPPVRRTVEELIGYMESDEVIEVTPKSVRLRKKLLDSGERERAARVKSKQIRADKER